MVRLTESPTPTPGRLPSGRETAGVRSVTAMGPPPPSSSLPPAADGGRTERAMVCDRGPVIVAGSSPRARVPSDPYGAVRVTSLPLLRRHQTEAMGWDAEQSGG